MKSAKFSDRMVGTKSGSTKEKYLTHMAMVTGSHMITSILSFIKSIWHDHLELADYGGMESAMMILK